MKTQDVQHKVLEVKVPTRLDKYLFENQLSTSRSESLKWIKDGLVFVNGKKQRASYQVLQDDKITIQKPSLKIMDLEPLDLNLSVVFEDDFLIVINKEPHLVVHPAAGHYDKSLVHGLLHHCKGQLSGIGGVERPGIVHRLDKGTSGLIVIAKTDAAHHSLSDQFQNREVSKTYLALAKGGFDKQTHHVENLIKRSEINRKKFVVNQKKGKVAISKFYSLFQNPLATFTKVEILTGRTHQIRVHLNHLQHPILGDETYGGTKKLGSFDADQKAFIKDLKRPLLHSYKMEFKHPKTNQVVSCKAPLHQDFIDAFQVLKMEFDYENL